MNNSIYFVKCYKKQKFYLDGFLPTCHIILFSIFDKKPGRENLTFAYFFLGTQNICEGIRMVHGVYGK